MPGDITIPEIFYNPSDPYNFQKDNLPLSNLYAKLNIISEVLDSTRASVNDAVGSVGSLDGRLSVSLNYDGTLKSAAIDAAEHLISAHTDDTDQSSFLIGGDTFVRMTERERAKLNNVEDGATNLTLTLDISTTPISFTSGDVILADSVSSNWRYTAGKIYLDFAYPVASAHQHYCNIIPSTSNHINFTLSTSYISGSLKIYINGTRITSNPHSVYAPGYLPSLSWTLNSFTESSPTLGTFILQNAITSNDVIVVDYDQSYV